MAEVHQTVTIQMKTSNTRVISTENSSTAKENLKGFLPLIGVAQVLGIFPILLIIYWIFHYSDGLKLPTKRSINWHMLLLCIGMIYFNGNSILAFRIFRNLPKDTLKLIHAIFQTVSCVLSALGIWAAYPIDGLFSYYTLHSWIGIFIMSVYIAQTIGGLYAFLYPGIAANSRASLMPYHRFAGQFLLILAVMTATIGINEKAMFKLEKLYKKQPLEGILLNLSGILFTLFAIVVIYLASSLDYKRYPRLQDNVARRNE